MIVYNAFDTYESDNAPVGRNSVRSERGFSICAYGEHIRYTHHRGIANISRPAELVYLGKCDRSCGRARRDEFGEEAIKRLEAFVASEPSVGDKIELC